MPKSRGGNRILLVEWFVFFAHGSMQSGDGLNEVVFQLYIFISIFYINIVFSINTLNFSLNIIYGILRSRVILLKNIIFAIMAVERR